MPGLSYRAVQAEPAPQVYADSVAQALRQMQADAALRKVVLARTLAVTANSALPQDVIFRRLAQDATVTAFRVALPGQGRALIGATPELLVSKTGGQITSHPLAGSARRAMERAADRAARDGLARSDKDRREHAIVVEYILDTLAPCCRDLTCPEGTTLTSTRSMWHLGTRITGALRDADMPSVLLASVLHPTPAVCGLPCDRAAALIRQVEPVDRQFYAGAVGWTDLDRQGDGGWYVAIRCADICGDHARLYAGAGIVPGSDPLCETAETGAKFSAMLQVLGLPNDTALDKE
ncbi:MAG: isochorismate synthase [Paracoccus sp. (in: a-proteobacteria)]|nr:isochorismate synthase [Paracoccus sp. (in: a-proteobacteria)]